MLKDSTEKRCIGSESVSEFPPIATAATFFGVRESASQQTSGEIRKSPAASDLTLTRKSGTKRDSDREAILRPEFQKKLCRSLRAPCLKTFPGQNPGTAPGPHQRPNLQGNKAPPGSCAPPLRRARHVWR